MGEADQFIKRVFRDETERATGEAVHFENAPEIATPSLTPDGLLVLALGPSALASLPHPWCLLHDRAVTDFKMAGDHMDLLALARAEHRRMACWVRHLEQDPRPERPHPEQFETWLVAPYLPAWLQDPTECDPLTITRVGAGCYRIGPRDHTVLWVAANELPLHPSLIPFLWARSGRPLVIFVRWLAGLRGIQPVAAVLRSHPMRTQIAQQITETPTENDEEHRRSVEMTRILLKGFPEAANEIRQEVTEKALAPLEHLFVRRLGRTLSSEERATMVRRLDTHGPDRLGDVVLDLDRDALERWLTDPDAR